MPCLSPSKQELEGPANHSLDLALSVHGDSLSPQPVSTTQKTQEAV